MEGLHAFVPLERDRQWQRSFKDQLHPSMRLDFMSLVLVTLWLCTEVLEEQRNRKTDLPQRFFCHSVMMGRWWTIPGPISYSFICAFGASLLPLFLGYSKGISAQNGACLYVWFLPSVPKSISGARAQRWGACIDFNSLSFIAAFNQMIISFLIE